MFYIKLYCSIIHCTLYHVVQMFDKENFNVHKILTSKALDKLIVGFIGGSYTKREMLIGKTLTNCLAFIKFIILFHRPTIVLYYMLFTLYTCNLRVNDS